MTTLESQLENRGYLMRALKKHGLLGAIDKILNLAIQEYWKNRRYFSTRRLFVNHKNVVVDKPIFLLGVQGAGITIISRMLRRNKNIVTVSGNYKYWAGLDELDKHDKKLPDDFALRAPGFKNMTDDTSAHETFGLERSWVYASDDLVDQYRKTPENTSSDAAARFLAYIKNCIVTYAPDIKTSRFLDKSQSYTLKIPAIADIFPDVKFLVIARNPYAMCWREATSEVEHRYRDWCIIPEFKERLEYAAQHWTNTYKFALDDIDRLDNGKVVIFEDFLDSPRKSIIDICDYLEIEFYEDMVPSGEHKIPRGSIDPDKWYPIRKDVNTRYLNAMTGEAIEIIDAIAGDVARKLGYQKPEPAK